MNRQWVRGWIVAALVALAPGAGSEVPASRQSAGTARVEQFDGEVPDVVLYPTGGGTGLVGMWKSFDEMQALGWIAQGRRPRLVAVQAAGCAPIAKAFLERSDRTEPWPDAQTRAYRLRVPSPIGGFLCVRALRQTNGTAVVVFNTGTGLKYR